MEAKSKHIHKKYNSVRENVKETKGVQKAYYHWPIDYWSHKAITKYNESFILLKRIRQNIYSVHISINITRVLFEVDIWKGTQMVNR